MGHKTDLQAHNEQIEALIDLAESMPEEIKTCSVKLNINTSDISGSIYYVASRYNDGSIIEYHGAGTVDTVNGLTVTEVATYSPFVVYCKKSSGTPTWTVSNGEQLFNYNMGDTTRSFFGAMTDNANGTMTLTVT